MTTSQVRTTRLAAAAIVAPPAVVLLSLVIHTDGAAAFNTAGGVLEIGGLLLVVRGLSTHRREFGDGVGLLQAAGRSLVQWVKVKLRGTHHVSRSITMHAESAGVSVDTASADVVFSGETLERRIEQLEDGLRETRQGLRRLEAANDQQHSKLRGAIAAERSDRNNAVGRVERRVNQLATGSIQLELTGVWWVGIGIILETWAAPLASVFR